MFMAFTEGVDSLLGVAAALLLACGDLVALPEGGGLLVTQGDPVDQRGEGRSTVVLAAVISTHASIGKVKTPNWPEKPVKPLSCDNGDIKLFSQAQPTKGITS